MDLKTTLSLQNGIFFQSGVSKVLSNQEKIYLYRARHTLVVAYELTLFSKNNLFKIL